MKAQTRPPALIFQNRPLGAKGGSRMCLVLLPLGYPQKMLVHELHHVKQWWLITLFAAVLLFALAAVVPLVSYYVIALSVWPYAAMYHLSAAFRFRVEAAAYAAGFTSEPNEQDQYANALSSSLYSTGKTFDECKRAIALRLYTGKLF
jgi:hypothetical protein